MNVMIQKLLSVMLPCGGLTPPLVCGAMLILLSVLPVVHSTVHADVVRYTDRDGRTHYVDSPAKVPPEYRQQLLGAKPLPNINRDDDLRFRSVEDRTAGPAVRRKRIDVYVTSWCGYCRALEAELTRRGIPFNRYDIERDVAAQRRHAGLGGRGIPLTVVGDAVIRGNDIEGIVRALER